MSFGFRSQLRVGQLGEVLFYKAHEGLERLDGYKSDFKDADGRHIELKSDLYSMADTPNYFMERYSDKAKQSPGGPWQSLKNGVNLFVYFFVPSLTYFTFDTAKLVGRLEEIEGDLAKVDVKNTNYVTMGYRVPRDLLADIAAESTIEVTARRK